MTHLKQLFSIAGLCLALPLAGNAAAPTVTYIYTDSQGTPLAETDEQGNVTATFDYRPYGAQALGTPPQGPGYTGHVNDADTGFVYMQARYYDPLAGRFLSVDPVGPTAGNEFNFNRYAYVYNNPVNHLDPDGRDCVASNGRATCTPTKNGAPVQGLPSFSVPVSRKYPSMNGNSQWHHEYIYSTPIGSKSADSVRDSIANDPTGNHENKPATPTGTANDASPTDGARGFFAGAVNNDVKSYTFNDASGAKWEVNVTEPSHTLFPGYVLRGVVDGNAVSYGEGTSWKQALGLASDVSINNVWIDQNKRNIDNAN
jgi:RHS repeat-associated protein